MVKAKRKKPPVKNPANTPTPRPSLIGNAFWQQRSKHGRDTLFATPELMREAAFEYFKWCDANPDYRVEARTEDGMTVNHPVPVRRPYTLLGVCRYMNASAAYLRVFKLTSSDEGFLTVIKEIEETVADQQVSGAMNGFFNGNLVSRLNNIADRHDVTSGDQPLQAPKVNVYNTAPPLAGNESDVAL